MYYPQASSQSSYAENAQASHLVATQPKNALSTIAKHISVFLSKTHASIETHPLAPIQHANHATKPSQSTRRSSSKSRKTYHSHSQIFPPIVNAASQLLPTKRRREISSSSIHDRVPFAIITHEDLPSMLKLYPNLTSALDAVSALLFSVLFSCLLFTPARLGQTPNHPITQGSTPHPARASRVALSFQYESRWISCSGCGAGLGFEVRASLACESGWLAPSNAEMKPPDIFNGALALGTARAGKTGIFVSGKGR